MDLNLRLDRLRSKYLGKVFESNNYGKFKVTKVSISKDNIALAMVSFLNSGHEDCFSISSVRSLSVKDWSVPSVFGMGVAFKKASVLHNKEYSLWRNMLLRCYCKSYLKNKPCYLECYVCDRWLYFREFLHDICKIDGYEKWRLYGSKKFELDKDSKFPGNKEYCLDKCCFLDKKLNSMMGGRKKWTKNK